MQTLRQPNVDIEGQTRSRKRPHRPAVEGNRVAFHCYFDVNVAGEDHRHQLSPGLDEKGKPDRTEFPDSAAAFKKLFTPKR
jgi:hypothetical protein